ncbi:TonB-dependent receptor [Imperialibacter roseus]|uniref:TonB-dependent receptor n=1 Tax=Imperialibacter roseus TaxID=1324217 RepID=A0ABZ0IPU7_9BACT|nr:TonB-dependent receptor [Imperialibacter roseus]WOK06010.1 TonB-dependent receptor [Imperialibacter roseus]
MKKCLLIVLIALLPTAVVVAQETVQGRIEDMAGSSLPGVRIFVEGTSLFVVSDADGYFSLSGLPKGTGELTAYLYGYETLRHKLDDRGISPIVLRLKELEKELHELVIDGSSDEMFSMKTLRGVEGTSIYEAKKTEVIQLEEIVANKSANNARQVFSRIPGANVWESDCAGLQIGVATRGLSPNRNSNFNTRQNGYDIAADALGYPESYYSPAIQAVDRIEIVRGAASLQYGTQFGGLVNFVMKKGPVDRKLAVSTEQTYNSLGFYNSFLSAGGQVGKVNYYAYNRTASGQCWRCNSDFNSTTTYGRVAYQLSASTSLEADYTHLYYLAQQPGGLTDNEFYADPRQSKRERNWFKVNWNLMSAQLNHSFTSTLRLNSRFFGLVAGREALGNLGRIDRPDDETQNRDFLSDSFRNFGNETRLIWNYKVGRQYSALLVGGRIYNGFTVRKQGAGPAGKEADFRYLNPERLEGSDFDLPSFNTAAFVENIFSISEKFSVTPGLRLEHIRTGADGYYRDTRTDLAGNVIYDSTVYENKTNERKFLFGGIGLSFKPTGQIEFYGNFSQNYRAINFNDIRVNNPSLSVDENLTDETGYNMDVGARGVGGQLISYDVSGFYLGYNNRIGTVLRTEPDPRFDNLIDRTFRYRTNIADAGIVGLESLVELNIDRLIAPDQDRWQLAFFNNLAIIHSVYLRSGEPGIEGNQVELVPKVSYRTGLTYRGGPLQLSVQYTYLSQQFSDASNADSNPPVPTAVEGVIPAYFVVDFSARYAPNRFYFESGVNNMTDNMYFTRRAAGYPGPGIIPSDGRSIYFSIGIKL